jgi:hypothetical protein
VPRTKNLSDWADRQIALLERSVHVEGEAFVDVLAAWLAALAPFVLCIEDLHDASADRLQLWTGPASVVGRYPRLIPSISRCLAGP